MLGAIVMIGILGGLTMACLADRYPEWDKVLETGGGALMIGAFALLGALMPMHP